MECIDEIEDIFSNIDRVINQFFPKSVPLSEKIKVLFQLKSESDIIENLKNCSDLNGIDIQKNKTESEKLRESYSDWKRDYLQVKSRLHHNFDLYKKTISTLKFYDEDFKDTELEILEKSKISLLKKQIQDFEDRLLKELDLENDVSKFLELGGRILSYKRFFQDTNDFGMCPICTKERVCMTVNDCGHTFCLPCVNRMERCPYCRVLITKSKKLHIF